MRVLFTPLALPAHALLMVPLAWACRAGGHEVRLATQPRMVDTITRAGLPAVAVGADADFLTAAVAFIQANPDLIRGGVRPMPAGNPWLAAGRAVARDVVPFARWWKPDVIVTDPMCYAGPLVAEVLGVPLVRHLWGPDWAKTGFGLGGVAEGDPTPLRWPPELIELYESYGARTAVDFAAWTIDPFPPSLQVPGLANRVTMRHVPYNGSGAVPDWAALAPSRPRVLVTWGTSTTEFLGETAFLVPQIVAGLAGLDVEIVLAIGPADRDRLGAAAGAARVVEGVPLDLLLPTCAAIVNQGGASTIATAATHGVPQIVIPQIADQPSNAALLAATGAGACLDPAALGPEELRAAVAAAVFDAAPRAAAARLRAENLASPAPAAIVARLEDLAA